MPIADKRCHKTSTHQKYISMCSASITSSSPSAFAVEATVKGIMSVKTLTDSLATSKLSSKRDSASKDRVTFDKVVIQEHAIIVGDNPACSGGAPIR